MVSGCPSTDGHERLPSKWPCRRHLGLDSRSPDSAEDKLRGNDRRIERETSQMRPLAHHNDTHHKGA
jgi:hypothetical protein